MSDVHLGDGATFSRSCSKCHSTVTVLTPNKNGHGEDQAAWGAWRSLVRSQIAWPLLCPECRQWWNSRINATDRARSVAKCRQCGSAEGACATVGDGCPWSLNPDLPVSLRGVR